jgi:tetratricopeptide (TPR) repeat protein
MTLTCPGCGFVSGAEARYCRMCGTPLPRAANGVGGVADAVSPHADTVPLAGATEDISAHDTASPVASPTSRVGRDFEEFRLRAEAAHARLEAERQAADQPWPSAHDAAARAGGVGGDDEVTTINVRAIDDEGRAPSAGLRRAADTGELVEQQTTSRHAGRHQTTTRAAAPGATGGNVERRALRLWLGLAIFGVVIVLCVAAAVVVGWYATRGGRVERPAAAGDTAAAVNAAGSSAPAAPPAAEDAKQQAAARLAEAEQLLASGRTDEAVARLRDAATLDPANAEPHRRLARLLLDSGSRRTAIEELRAVLRIEPNDAQAWRELARAQAAEGLHRDAAESYRRLFEVSAEARRDDRLQLARADALLRAGRENDARAAYERLASSRVAEVARASRRQLDRLAREDENANAEGSTNTSAAASPSPSATRDARSSDAGEREAERVRGESTPRPSDPASPEAGRESASSARLSPRERYERGVRLWQSNRAAAVADFAAAAQAGNSDAHYYLGLNLVEGRAVTALSRGELIAALSYFQRARRGRHSTEARRREEELGREYDRRRAGGRDR